MLCPSARACVQAVSEWGVGYIVLTSVDRDDVADGGAAHFARTVELIKRKSPQMLVECLTPDFSGNMAHVRVLASSGLDVFAHNIETVHRLQVCCTAGPHKPVTPSAGHWPRSRAAEVHAHEGPLPCGCWCCVPERMRVTACACMVPCQGRDVHTHVPLAAPRWRGATRGMANVHRPLLSTLPLISAPVQLRVRQQTPLKASLHPNSPSAPACCLSWRCCGCCREPRPLPLAQNGTAPPHATPAASRSAGARDVTSGCCAQAVKQTLVARWACGCADRTLPVQGRVRDRRANYEQSLAVLREAKACGVYTKSSIMLGLGESDDEVIDTLLDLRDCGVDIVTFGQYLQPTPRHLTVQEFVRPEKFEHWRHYGEDVVGFRCVHQCICLCPSHVPTRLAVHVRS